jgi:Mg-chelatase subunit ChlD
MLALVAALLATSVVVLPPPPAKPTPAKPALEQPAPEKPAAEQPRPRIDVAFALDTTGSMGDEIDVVKARIVEIARKVSAGQPRPDVRFGIVAYRDRGDLYLTRLFPFTREIAEVQRSLDTLDANGGGDEPEAVAEGLSVAVHELSWDKSSTVARMIFLIGDAGPHEYPDGKNWRTVAGEAQQRGIVVHAIGCSGLSAWGDGVFAQIAHRTGGDLAHLTYAVAMRGAGGAPKTMLKAGERSYVADKALSAEEWKKGAEALAREGKVRAARADEVAASAGSLAGLGAATMAAPRGMGAGGRGAAKADDTNNLDAEIAGRIVNAAKAKGVAY